MTVSLPPEGRQEIKFGPRIFDDAAACPALAALTISGRTLPMHVPRPRRAEMPPAWLATKELLVATMRAGATSPGSIAATTLRYQPTAVQRYATAAVDHLLDALDALRPGLTPRYVDQWYDMVIGPAQVHSGGAFIFGFGDGSALILRLRIGAARATDDRAERWGLTAAHVLLSNESRIETVTVAEVGGADGSTISIGSWGRSEVAARFQTSCESTFAAMARDWQYMPGPHCAGCVLVGLCPSARRTDGLLEGVPGSMFVRKLTAGDLRNHGECAARYKLQRVDGLPPVATDSTEQERGRFAQRWLNRRHAHNTCCHDPFLSEPEPADDDVLAAMLRHHVDVCPFLDADATSARVEPNIVALDSASNVLLVARPDLAYITEGRVRWRETKTTGTVGANDPLRLVTTDFAAALYFTLLAAGVDGSPDVLEWEVLTPDRCELTILDATDSNLIDIARRTISSAVADLVGDHALAARPGTICVNCALQQWCPACP